MGGFWACFYHLFYQLLVDSADQENFNSARFQVIPTVTVTTVCILFATGTSKKNLFSAWTKQFFQAQRSTIFEQRPILKEPSSIDSEVKRITDLGFNCVRVAYSLEAHVRQAF